MENGSPCRPSTTALISSRPIVARSMALIRTPALRTISRRTLWLGEEPCQPAQRYLDPVGPGCQLITQLVAALLHQEEIEQGPEAFRLGRDGDGPGRPIAIAAEERLGGELAPGIEGRIERRIR